MRKLLILSLLLIFSQFSLGIINNGQIKLLAVSESQDGTMHGSVADMYLEIKPGKGRVFIDTFPFTKLDTQFTTRYAKNIACNYAEVDCSNYDFFYTIKAGSTIIGGPSAGAATTLLTLSMLNDEELPIDISVTGTINSGGIIGPVGGTLEKIEAAYWKGIKKVYISKIGLNESLFDNSSLDELIEVMPLFNFDELYEEVFGISLHGDISEILPSRNYESVMKEISLNLCNQAKEIRESTLKNIDNVSLLYEGDSLYNLSLNETWNNDYYSAASYCFGAASMYKTQEVLLMNQSDINQLYHLVLSDYLEFSEKYSNIEIRSFTDLQTYMITTQRLTEVSDTLFKINMTNITNSSKSNLAYSAVRLKSAEYWARFFGTEYDENFAFDDSALMNSCFMKLNEVEGYLNYLSDYLNLPLSTTRESLDHAYTDYHNQDYALCLFKAIKSKADADLILSSLSIKKDDIENLIIEKEKVAKRSIYESMDNGVFPILAYSYYTYAQTLAPDDYYSSLLYFEYASAMSDISIYFEKEQQLPSFKFMVSESVYLVFFLGFFFGAFFSYFVIKLFSFNKKPRRKKNRR